MQCTLVLHGRDDPNSTSRSLTCYDDDSVNVRRSSMLSDSGCGDLGSVLLVSLSSATWIALVASLVLMTASSHFVATHTKGELVKPVPKSTCCYLIQDSRVLLATRR